VPVSIREVAAKAGVSPSTVSQVLNENFKVNISEVTRDRVRGVAAEMGYRPNQFARSLGRRKTDTIGLMVSAISNPFFADLVEKAERMLFESGYQVFLDSGPAELGSYAEHAKLRGWPVDGVLIWAFPDQTLEHFLASQAIGTPVVYMGYQRSDDGDCVYFDTYAGCRVALVHLKERGYTRVGFISPGEIGNMRASNKIHAYRDFCREAGWEERVVLQKRQEQTRRAGFETGLALAALPAHERPDAVICNNDVIAHGVYFGARRGGLRIPDDLAIVGFDGLEESLYLDIPLTTVVLPCEEMCLKSLAVLQSRLDKTAGPEPQSVRIETPLRIGEST